MTEPLTFFAIEVNIYTPGAPVETFDVGYGAVPVGALSVLPDAPATQTTIYASDSGYRSAPTDAIGIRRYPPYVSQAFLLDRQVTLGPAQTAVGASWGTMELANSDGSFTEIGSTANSDGRDVRVLYGVKPYDRSRGIHLDPPYTALAEAFVGFATPWFLSDASLSIPLRDASYWMEQPLQTTLYLGTGSYQGPTTLTGTPLPKTRGGTQSNPIRNITPLLIDAPNQIYQYNDARGTIVSLYEGAYAGIAYAGDTNNLYAGTTPPGKYRTDNSRGLFQLGSIPTNTITADVTGWFPSGALYTTIASIALGLLVEDIEMPPENIDYASFTAADTAYPYVAGVFFSPTQSNIDGVNAINDVIATIGAKIIPRREGTLSLLVLRALTGVETVTLTIGQTNAVSVTPIAIDATLDPPPYRWRVGYNHNYTVQTSGILPLATPAQQSFVALQDQYATFASTEILLAYRRPNDSAPVSGALLSQGDAQQVANDLGTLWGTRRRLYDVVLPLSVGLTLDLGQVVSITWPMDDLAYGKTGQIVGEQFRSSDSTITYRVLMNGITALPLSEQDFYSDDVLTTPVQGE